jgi:uncharacterized peroxidase-related enzyme
MPTTSVPRTHQTSLPAHAAHDYREADIEPRVRALCDFAVKLTHEPASVSAADADGLRSHGWSDAGIHDAIQVIAFFNYINRVADGVGIELESKCADSPTI